MNQTKEQCICPNCNTERSKPFPISDESGETYCPDCNMSFKKEVKHTALPWSKVHQTYRTGYETNQTNISLGHVIDSVKVNGNNSEANAEFIVKACNSHYELLEAVKECQSYILKNNFKITNINDFHIANVMAQAISKVEGKG